MTRKIKEVPVSPFDKDRFIGTVLKITPNYTKVALPFASKPTAKQLHGQYIGAGEVGELVFFEDSDRTILGRITEVTLEDSDMMKKQTQPEPVQANNLSSIGIIQLLAQWDFITGEVSRGISRYPRIGAFVYSAHPKLVQLISQGEIESGAPVIDLALIPHSDVSVSVLPEDLFGRHLAILGSSGGGKSWSVARIVQEIRDKGGKVILIDPTGEFHATDGGTVHLAVKEVEHKNEELVSFSYKHLTESDLFAIFQPSLGMQAPALRSAIRHLKLVGLDPNCADENGIVKIESKSDLDHIMQLEREKFKELIRPGADFNIMNLVEQIQQECYKFDSYGNLKFDDFKYSACYPMVSRIEGAIISDELAFLFDPSSDASLVDKIDEFLCDDTTNVLRISLKNVSYERSAREILVNSLGRLLLNRARKGAFKELPTVIVLDEAHQFLNKNIGDEEMSFKLDAFGLIAKEGRKYGLTTVLATQRPRDIPHDVLSQMGSMIVHRLVNEGDIAVIEKASGDLDKSILNFLPTLNQGEAIILGTGHPIPLTMHIIQPNEKPDSKGPDYSKYYKK
ncbi:ATP-binding protein [Candidatus Roizmanbacteria bacterium]|nr:ATP-binding protein [Candidatus Roizmanbacteria bacterium]